MNARTANDLGIQQRIARLAELDQKIKDLCDRFDAKNYAACQELRELEEERRIGRQTGWGPIVGMPCTYRIGTDSYAATVTSVSASAHKITIKVESAGFKVESAGFVVLTRRHGDCYRPTGKKYGYVSFLQAVTRLDPNF